MINISYMRIELLLLSILLSTYEAGIYCAQYQIVVLFFMIPALVYMTLMPNLYKQHKDKALLRHIYTNACRYLNLYAVIAIPLIIYMADELMVLVGGEALRNQSSGLRLLAFMLVFLFAGLSLNYLNVLDLLNKRIKYETIGITLLTVGGLYAIPIYKINGIAVLAAITYGITGVLAFLCLTRYGIVDLKQIFMDLTKVICAASISSLIFIYGSSVKLLNVCMYIGLIIILITLFKFWKDVDRRLLGQFKNVLLRKNIS